MIWWWHPLLNRTLHARLRQNPTFGKKALTGGLVNFLSWLASRGQQARAKPTLGEGFTVSHVAVPDTFCNLIAFCLALDIFLHFFWLGGCLGQNNHSDRAEKIFRTALIFYVILKVTSGRAEILKVLNVNIIPSIPYSFNHNQSIPS
jgi:hypothetical protein